MLKGFDSRYATPPYPEGFDFAMFKATEGSGFKTGILDKQTAGLDIPWGVWHYWRAAFSAEAQAENFYEYTMSVGQPKWIVLDCEDTIAPKKGSTPAKILDCLEAIEDIFGMRPLIYSGKWWWDPWVGTASWANLYEWWVAHYTTAAAPALPVGVFDWKIWQHKGDVAYPGFNQKIDLNRMKEDTPPPPPPSDLEKRVAAIETTLERIREAWND